jgi:hypothetical protein
MLQGSLVVMWALALQHIAEGALRPGHESAADLKFGKRNIFAGAL